MDPNIQFSQNPYFEEHYLLMAPTSTGMQQTPSKKNCNSAGQAAFVEVKGQSPCISTENVGGEIVGGEVQGWDRWETDRGLLFTS